MSDSKVLEIAALVNGYHNDGTTLTAAETLAEIAKVLGKPMEAGPSSSPREGPIQLNAAQESAVKEWAADDRLWTTQDTVEINLRTFARVVLREAALALQAAEQREALLRESLVTSRDALAAFGREAGYLPMQGGYTATMTPGEIQAARAVAAIDEILASLPKSPQEADRNPNG